MQVAGTGCVMRLCMWCVCAWVCRGKETASFSTNEAGAEDMHDAALGGETVWMWSLEGGKLDDSGARERDAICDAMRFLDLQRAGRTDLDSTKQEQE